MPVVDLKLTGRRLGQEGLARAARSIQENAVLNHPVLFEPLGMKPVLYDRVDAPLLLLHPADVRERPRRDVGPSGLAVLPAAETPAAIWTPPPCGLRRITKIRPPVATTAKISPYASSSGGALSRESIMPVTASSWNRNSLIELNQWRTGSNVMK